MILRLLCSLLITSRLLAEPSALQALPSARLTPYVPATDTVDRFLTTSFTENFSLHAIPGGGKLGTCRFAWSKPDQSTLEYQETTEYRYKLGSAEFVQRTREVWMFDARPPYDLRSAQRVASLQEKKMTTTLTRTGRGEYHAEVTEAGETRTRDYSNLQLTVLDKVGFRMWAKTPSHQRGDCQAFRGFDLKAMEPYSDRHCILSISDGDGVTQAQCENLKDHFSFDYQLSGDGHLLGGTLANSLTLRKANVESPTAPHDAEDVLAASLLRCPRAIGNEIQSGKILTVTLRGPGLRDLPKTAFQKVKLDATGQSAKILTGPGAGSPMPATAEEMKESLAATMPIPWRDSRVLNLSRQACQGAKSTEEKVRRLLKFVSTYVINDDRIKPIGLVTLLKDPRGDCTAHSLLFTALARAAGISCREASGYMYLSDKARAFGGHAWNEVVIDGHWHPVDPTWNQFNLDAGHIQLSAGAPTLHDSQFFRGEMTMSLE